MAARLDPEKALLLAIDMQEVFAPTIPNWERVIERSVNLIRGAKILGVPILWAEQSPEKLGPTTARIAAAIGEAGNPVGKQSFSCFGEPRLLDAAEGFDRKQLIVCGIETQVCICQTTLAALDAGWEVFLAEDAIDSRRTEDREAALKRLYQAGAVPCSVEMILMELTRRADHPSFRQLLALIKESGSGAT